MHLFEALTMEEIAQRLNLGVSAAWRRFRKGSELYARCMHEGDGGGNGSAR
jgi:DNA-directed RNA polymerase specialized sigma24 family protein